MARATGWSVDATGRRNARALGVGERVIFQHASASTLPLEDGSMDAIVSHFVFHEVKDGGGPVGALKEAIRVLKPGGAFAFQDMFLDRRLYGDVDALSQRSAAGALKKSASQAYRTSSASRGAWAAAACSAPRV